MSDVNRRDLLKYGAGIVAASAYAGLSRNLFAQDAPKTIRVAWIGTGGRGTGMLEVLLKTQDNVELTAICDIKEENAKHAAAVVKRIKGNDVPLYTRGDFDYRRMLERDDFEAVVITTPTVLHCAMSIDAMKAGKHVGCEVPAGYDIEELMEVVKTKEQSGKHFMLCENYCYTQRNMMIHNMSKQGAFGDPYYGEGAYIHSVKSLYFNSDGSIAWRGIAHRDMNGNWYPTHALGPVAKWFQLNDGDRIDYCTTMGTDPRVMHEYSVEQFGPDSGPAKIDWKMSDFISTFIHTAKGKMIRVDVDMQSHRPASNYYLLQGTKASYDSRSGLFVVGNPESWDNPDSYLEKYNHKYWQGQMYEKAKNAGHGGGDYFVMRDFIDMVRYDREPWIDVYDGAFWSALYHVSKLSLDRKSAPIEMPDFTDGKWKDPAWRKKSQII